MHERKWLLGVVVELRDSAPRPPAVQRVQLIESQGCIVAVGRNLP